MKYSLSQSILLIFSVLFCMGMVQILYQPQPVIAFDGREMNELEERWENLFEEIRENLHLMRNQNNKRDGESIHPGRGPHNELERLREKIEHLRIAAEHLQHAGMNEMAAKIRVRVENMEREADEMSRNIKHHGPPHGVPLDQLHGEIRELREVVKDQGKAIKELKKLIQETAEP